MMKSNPARCANEEIPLQAPWLGAAEERAVAQAVRLGDLVGGGRVCRRVEGKLRERFGARHVLLTTSCSHALEMALMALGVGPGDEVILPSFTFASCANAVVLRGAKCVFADLRPGDLNVDPEDIRRRATERTKAIMPVHYAGVACDMDPILAVGREVGAAVVEDAAQGVDAGYKGRFLGTIGDAGCYSFHATKSVTCGEGGAFLTNDGELARRAEIVREKGTNRSAFMRGEVDKYSWVAPGSSYVLSDVLAALLEAQLDRLEEIKRRRRALWKIYSDALAPLEQEGWLRLPRIGEGCEPNWQIFWFLASTPDARSEMLKELRAQGVGATFHYVPLHSAPYMLQSGAAPPDLPETTRAAATLVRLPLYPQLPPETAEAIAKMVAELAARSPARREGGHGADAP